MERSLKLTAKEVVIEIDGTVINTEVALEKAMVTIWDLMEQYFSEKEPDEFALKCYYHQAGVKCSIVRDYLKEMSNHLKEVKKVTDIVYHEK